MDKMYVDIAIISQSYTCSVTDRSQVGYFTPFPPYHFYSYTYSHFYSIYISSTNTTAYFLPMCSTPVASISFMQV